MEQEYKWILPQETLRTLAADLHNAPERVSSDTINMAAIYYDTPDDLVYRSGAALRIRRENAHSVCCMKRTLTKDGACAVREEYEVEAETVAEGLQKLPDAGAPHALCEMLANQPFRELARTEFVRRCILLRYETFTAELAVDVGMLGGGANMLPFEELELELKSGDEAAFHAYAKELEAQFSLCPQTQSKLARAIQAAAGKE